MRYQPLLGKPTPPNIVRDLRALTPDRPLRASEALDLAELQANRLLLLTGQQYASPVPISIITDLPHFTLQHDPQLPIAGASYWDAEARSWVIRLSPTISSGRRRFRLLHEFKHILDFASGRPGGHACGRHGTDSDLEAAADHFAASVLLPKRAIRDLAAHEGHLVPSLVAARFDVPEAIAEARLRQLGLLAPRASYLTARRPEVMP